MSYNHFEHRHRFAVWASARAAQRAFTSVENLRDAIDSTDIRRFIHDLNSLDCDHQTFETHHRKWCNAIVEFLSDKGIQNATFGRAAKLVAVYIKSMIVITSNTTTSLASVAHPPIDRILLQNLASAEKLNLQNKALWQKTAWTQLDEKMYYELLVTLRSIIPETEPWWKIEQYWTITNE